MRHAFFAIVFLGLGWTTFTQNPPPASGESGSIERRDRIRMTLDAGDHVGPITEVLFTPDGDSLVTAGSDHTVRVWDAPTGDSLRVLRPPGISECLCAALSPDGRLLAVNATYPVDDKTVRQVVYLMALGDGRIERVLEAGAAAGRGVRAVAFSPDGNRLIAGCSDAKLRLWDLAGKQPVAEIPTELPLIALAFSADGRRIVEAREDGTAYLRDLAGGATVALKAGKTVSPRDPRSRHQPVAWSPDGKTIATECTAVSASCRRKVPSASQR